MRRASLVVFLSVAAAIASWPRAIATAAPDVTFTRDVAPILHARCVVCHRAGEVAPMALLTYQDARPWARAIKDKVVARQMPPWFADPAVGAFANDPRLSAEDIATISRWVDAGAPQGDPKDMPAPPRFTEGWQLGEPDMVVELPEVQHSSDGDRLLSNAEPDAGLERGSLDSRRRDPSEQSCHHASLGDLLGQCFRDERAVFERDVRCARRLGGGDAADGLSRRDGTLGAQGPDAADEPALSPERNPAGRSDADRSLFRQGRDEEGSRCGARRQRHLLDSTERAELRAALGLHGRPGHQHRVVLSPHAPAGEGHEDDGDLSRRPAADAAERPGVRLQLAAVLLPEDQGPAAARHARRSGRALRQFRGATSTTRIRRRPSRLARRRRPPR